jgi:hypothetical protein
MKSELVVISDSCEAAQWVTITGWKSRRGIFYGDGPQGERAARYDGCTHRPCEACGKPAEKLYTHCPECRSKREIERYLALPAIPWDGSSMIFADATDEYFMDMESFLERCEDDDIDPIDMRPLICKPNIAREVEPDYWCDDLAEDGELPSELEEALDALNAVIRKHKFVLSWSAGKQRVDLVSQAGNRG